VKDSYIFLIKNDLNSLRGGGRGKSVRYINCFGNGIRDLSSPCKTLPPKGKRRLDSPHKENKK